MLLKNRSKLITMIMIATIALSNAVGGFGFSISVKASELYFYEESLTLEVGQCKQNEYGGYKGKVKWSSSNKKVATVDQKGLVLAKAKGKCDVIAKANGKKYKCKVKVKSVKSLSAKDMLKGLSEMENSTIYMDNKNKLNILHFIKCGDSSVNVIYYKEQSDGSMKKTYISWKSKYMLGASVQTGWIDESSGNLYFVASKANDTEGESYIYGIDKKGKLICKKKLEDYLEIEKMSYYSYGFQINYVGQKNGKVYLSMKDNSKNALIIFDMKKNCITKQVFCQGEVRAVVENQIISVTVDQNNITQSVEIGTIPVGEKKKWDNGNSIMTGETVTIQKFDMTNFWGLDVIGDDIYAINKYNYMRIKIGETNWTKFAETNWTEFDGFKIKCEAFKVMNDRFVKFLPINSKSFYVVFYEDNGSGTNIRRIEIK